MGILAAGRPDLISFAPGYPDPATFAWPAYLDIVDDLLRRRGSGDVAVRTDPRLWSADRRSSCLGWDAGASPARRTRSLLTTGSQQAVDLVTRLFVDPGDVVLVELPTFTGAIAAFRAAEAELVGVRQDDDGLDLDHLDAMLAAQRRAGRRVKFLYVIPNFQNPTGGLLSQERRRALLAWSLREGVLIVEDDPYGDLWFADVTRPEATRPIKADDTEGHVVYLQSTSKTLAPTFRTAWVVASGPIIARLDVAKQSADLCSSSLDQRIVHEAIVRGVLDEQLPRLRETYAHKRDAMSRGPVGSRRRPGALDAAARRILPVGAPARRAGHPGAVARRRCGAGASTFLARRSSSTEREPTPCASRSRPPPRRGSRRASRVWPA